MNQSDLIRAIADHCDMSPKTVEAVLKSQGAIVTEEMQLEGGEVTLPGLGKIKAATRDARAGRNPKTGETVDIPAKNIAKFQMAKALEGALNP